MDRPLPPARSSVPPSAPPDDEPAIVAACARPVLLQARGIRLARGNTELIAGLDFDIDAGSALLLRGANGSGKSTLLRALLGLTPVQAGELTVAGQQFAPGSGRMRPHALWLGHAHDLKAELSTIENLELTAGLDGTRPGRPALREALARVGLGRKLNVETRRLSQGQRQRLALARLLLAPHRPLWLLDEPTAALDQQGSGLLDELVAEHLAAGGGALVATHLPVLAGLPSTELSLGGGQTT